MQADRTRAPVTRPPPVERPAIVPVGRRGRWSLRPVALGAALAAIIALTLSAHAVVEPPVSIVVDFGSVPVPTPASNIGFTATTFDVDGGDITRSPGDAATLSELGAGAVRIHLRQGEDGSVVTGAQGGVAGVPARRWLETYAGAGAQLTVVVDLDQAGALAVLRYLRSSGFRVHRFVIGNENDANSRADVPPEEYVKRFRAIARAMRAVDPTLQIGGPAPAYFEGLDQALVDGLVQAPTAERASFIDFHAYGAGEGERAAMSSSWRYADQLDLLRGMIDDPTVGMQVGEFNVNWSDEPNNNTQFQSVWVASALGTILSRGAVAFQYGDKNSAMGLVADGRPKASYWGIAAFTGAGRFRPFGTGMVSSVSSTGAVRVFASTGDKNVVIVNTGEVTSAGVALDGFAGGTATVWQSVAGEYTRAEPADVGTELDLPRLPALSITVIVLDERH